VQATDVIVEVEGFGMAGVMVFSGSCFSVYMERLRRVTKNRVPLRFELGTY
jgi:hypothetical protein